MNVCYCGTQAGYPHTADCPYPLFRGSEEDARRWEKAREAKASGDRRCLSERGGS